MFQITVIIVSGIVISAVIFISTFPRFHEFFKSKIPKTNLILGIIILSIAAILIIISIFWIDYVIYFLESPEVSGLMVGIIVCLILGIAAFASFVYGDVQNILNYMKAP